MARPQQIFILCPQYNRLVRGTYAAPVPLGASGHYSLEHVICGHQGGRCMQTLCVLHRYNRRGPGSWYPQQVLAAPVCASRAPRKAKPAPSGGSALNATA